ncbi:MAG: alpha/beta hydrolase [Salinirussus sp.]
MDDPHADQPVETAGASLADARAAVVLTHGRGATAKGMLGLARELDVDGVAFRAPQAARHTWYPDRFTAPIESNEPWLSSALAFLEREVETVRNAGLRRQQLVFVGFSQGGCLAAEFVARNATRYGGLAVLSGGLIGPEGTDFEYDGSLEATPAFLGCGDGDPHIPVERVHETRDALDQLDAEVTERIYDGLGHTVNRDELDNVERIITTTTGGVSV